MGDAVVVVVLFRWNFCLEVVIISGTIIFTRCYHSFRIGIILELNRILKFSRYCFINVVIDDVNMRERKNIISICISLSLFISPNLLLFYINLIFTFFLILLLHFFLRSIEANHLIFSSYCLLYIYIYYLSILLSKI